MCILVVKKKNYILSVTELCDLINIPNVVSGIVVISASATDATVRSRMNILTQMN